MTIPILERVSNIDLKNKNTITIILLFILILFAIIYIWQNKKHNVEGFAQYNITANDVVSLANLNSVLVGDNSTQLSSTINQLISDYISTNINNQYAKISDLQNTNSTVSSNFTNANNNLTSNIAIMNNNLTSNIALVNTSIASNIDIASPPLIIVSYYGSNVPTGWQLCNGLPLIAQDNQNVVYSSGGSYINVNTPDLRGRFILGQSTTHNIGTSGGEETHTLSIDEMPAHYHNMPVCCGASNGVNGSRLSTAVETTTNSGFWPAQSTGGNQPHNNMPPYYTLIYIIKKPKLGGNNYPISKPF